MVIFYCSLCSQGRIVLCFANYLCLDCWT